MLLVEARLDGHPVGHSLSDPVCWAAMSDCWTCDRSEQRMVVGQLGDDCDRLSDRRPVPPKPSEILIRNLECPSPKGSSTNDATV